MNFHLHGYRIIKQIGIGAGSHIYLALDQRTGERYAVKRIIRNSPEQDKFIEQAAVEYDVGNKVSHPCLRKFHSLHRVRKMLQLREINLVMEFVDGLPVEVARPNRLNTFLHIFLHAAAGLDAMHRCGYVHCDVKPNNIMIGRGGVVKLIDFGQSCPMGHRKERIQGTPDYIAPEQVRRLTLDRRTDVFNLGATMYWVLTSERYPTEIRGPDERGGISLITSDQPIAPMELNDKIPRPLSNLVMECCRDKPDERPPDMKAVTSRLQTIRRLWRQRLEELRANRRADRSARKGDRDREH